MTDEYLDELTQDELRELRETIVRAIERRGLSVGSAEERIRGAAQIKVFYDFLKKVEKRII